MKNAFLIGLLTIAPCLSLRGQTTPAAPTPEHPTGWRNDGTGHYPDATPPTEWSQAVTEGVYAARNILWKTRLPSHSASSPIVVGDKVFVTGSGNSGGSPMDLLCIDRRDGKVLWMRTLTGYDTVSESEKKALLKLQVTIDAARGRNIFLAANLKLDAGAAAEGNYDAAGAKVVKAEFVGDSKRIMKLTLAEPLKVGQPVRVTLKGVKAEDGQIANAEANGVAAPGKPVTREFIDDFLIGETREAAEFGKMIDQEWAGRAATQPVSTATWNFKPFRSRGPVSLLGVTGVTRPHGKAAGCPACVYLYSERPQTVEFRLASEGALTVAVNGSVVGKRAIWVRMPLADQDTVKDVPLKQGWNQVLIGVGISPACSEWDFALRVTDKDGAPPQGVFYSFVDDSADLADVYVKLSLPPDFAAVEAAARPLSEKLAALDGELVAKLNAMAAGNKTTLYPGQLPLNWPGVIDAHSTAWEGGPPADYPKANAAEAAFATARANLAGQINKLIVDYDGALYRQRPSNHYGWASATPCSDGRYVYFYYANRIAACFDLEGKSRWVAVHPFLNGFQGGHGTHGSPLLAEGKFVIPYLFQVLCLDAATGRLLWGQEMQRSGASEEAGVNSMVLARAGKDPVVVMSSGQGMLLATGKTAWQRLRGNKICCTSAVVQDGRIGILQDDGVQIAPVPASVGEAIKLEPKTFIKPKDFAANATEGRKGPVKPAGGTFNCYSIASPLLVDGLFYGVTSQGDLVVVDSKEDKILYQQRLDVRSVWPGLSASPTFAGGNIYIVGSQGTTFVIKPGRTYQQVARNVIESPYNDKGTEERFLANPVFAGKQIFLRGEQYLYCIGQ